MSIVDNKADKNLPYYFSQKFIYYRCSNDKKEV